MPVPGTDRANSPLRRVGELAPDIDAALAAHRPQCAGGRHHVRSGCSTRRPTTSRLAAPALIDAFLAGLATCRRGAPHGRCRACGRKRSSPDPLIARRQPRLG